VAEVRYLIVLVFWSGTVYGNSVDNWLMRINDAARLNYQGVFIYAYGSILESMRVVHRAEGGITKERIFSLNGAPREIIRDAEQVWCYVPEQQIGVHEYRKVSKQGFPNILPQGLARLSSNYALSLGRTGRIADRSAQQILISPLDEYRYGYVLWADQETGLLLKAALVTRDNEPIEQYMFTEVNIGGPIDVADLSPRTAREKLKWFAVEDDVQEPQNVSLEKPGWEINNIPDGFMISQQFKRLSPLRNSMMEHYVYSDGLAAVSVFIEMTDDGNAWTPVNGANRIGAVHAFGRTQDGYHITVVGEVPAQTVDMIGMSVTKILQ
jgi:sigma-E factor negative regulatory protein RseB